MTHVIIAEDDPMVAQLNAQYLSQIPDVQVDRVFHNGQEALAYLEEHRVELAILDMYMPICSGLELLRSIRGRGIGTSVILITAATEMQVVEEALRLGIEDYIVKPFQFQRLRDAVRNYRNKASLVRSSDRADQDVIDRLMSKDFLQESATRELRKGLNPKTLKSIEDLLWEARPQAQTCESISAASGLSKVTVRNYLNYLIEIGSLESAIDYETGGRPRVLYRMKGQALKCRMHNA